ncbi:MAG: twin-arginine translocase TatA/TatE family subunit [Verrucomicrobiota bacterium]
MNGSLFLAFGMPGGWEFVLIFLAVLLLFGAKRLPELARGIGKSLGEFRKAKAEFDRELHTAGEEVSKEANEVKKSIEKAAGDEQKKPKG